MISLMTSFSIRLILFSPGVSIMATGRPLMFPDALSQNCVTLLSCISVLKMLHLRMVFPDELFPDPLAPSNMMRNSSASASAGKRSCHAGWNEMTVPLNGKFTKKNKKLFHNSAIIYSTSCFSKPVCLWNTKIFWRMLVTKQFCFPFLFPSSIVFFFHSIFSMIWKSVGSNTVFFCVPQRNES